ncbi:hypothetical protein MMC07_002814 [Pseudocyphellaria aurata]|nr:hypothetical protein [Pseudocyphellaria aurata]
MPYTPPCSQSPAGSKPGTPPLTRSHSYGSSLPRNGSALKPTKPELPASSSSYLHKHRRSPSISRVTAPTSENPPGIATTPTSESLNGTKEPGKPVLAVSPPRQAPTRPVIKTDTAVAQESSSNSSDDESSKKRGRVRNLENLAELQAAIRIIEQHRMSSPDWRSEETKQARIALGLDDQPSGTLTKDLFTKPDASARLPLSAAARKISHSRSNTEPSALPDRNGQNGDSPARSNHGSDSDEVEDDELRIRPSMVRKKSGEVVRPALRPALAKRRPSSMPGTPTYSKAVHFDSRLEHVRHFLQVDRPLAVSAGSSPVESTFDDDVEFPFGGDDAKSTSFPFEWEIRLTNFPADTPERRSMPIRVERAYLSSDNKNLMGAIAAKNIAFHKLVVARFTLDYWKTTSEVVADYSREIRQKPDHDDCDRFLFSIKLEDQANLENKSLYFCVRYNVNGQEFWDNNNSINYQVDFSKKAKPQNGKNGMPGNIAKPLNGASRSKPSAAFLPRPRDPNPPRDDFSPGSVPYDFFSPPRPSAVVGDSPIRFKNAKQTRDVTPDTPGRRANAAGQAFGNRYDFGASLSAAIQAASASVGDRGGPPARDEAKSAPAKPLSFAPMHPTATPAVTSALANGTANGHVDIQKTSGVGNALKAASQEHSKPAALTAEKPSLQSSSYHELLDKYCFFGSGKPSAHSPADGQSQVDGASEKSDKSTKGDMVAISPRSSSPTPSPCRSPPVEDRKPSSVITSPRVSRPASPHAAVRLGSQAASPVPFGYAYRQPMQNGLFAETHIPTAILG